MKQNQKYFCVEKNDTIMFGRRSIICIKSKGFPVLYVKRVKVFKKRDTWDKLCCRRKLEVTNALS